MASKDDRFRRRFLTSDEKAAIKRRRYAGESVAELASEFGVTRACIRHVAPLGKASREREPTQEEVDRIVAEQMANLPDWWEDACDRQVKRRRHGELPRIIRDQEVRGAV